MREMETIEMKMKHLTLVLVCGILLPLTGGAQGLSNGPYTIRPLDINAGGTTSSAGLYSLSSSDGQAGGVGTTAQGPYTLSDGFWPGVPGVPTQEPTATSTPTKTPVVIVLPTKTPTLTPTMGEGPTPTQDFNFDHNGNINAADLLHLLSLIHDTSEPPSSLVDFSQFWHETVGP
jgi:hypothetical protein